MPQYIIELLDQDLKDRARGAKAYDVAAGTTVRDLKAALVTQWGLPRLDLRGEPRPYLMAYQGELLDDEDLLEVRVPEGGTLAMASPGTVA
ncbi:MAG: hypothetical protein VKO21_00825 [Candidatus Sericytochromatia bacterium]|nr:hypothetical protein [Candidatus Sericytochromatia bacterium]